MESKWRSLFKEGCGFHPGLSHCQIPLLALFLLGLVWMGPVGAATPQSGEDFTGDRLVLSSNAYGFVSLRDETIQDRIAMRGTILRVTQDDQQTLLVSVEAAPCVVESVEGRSIARRDKTHYGVGAYVDCPAEASDIERLVKVGEVYRVTKEQLGRYGYSRSGWVYGALLVPYKYHFDDKSFSSAATIGPYLGYSLSGMGIKSALIVSLGLSSLPVARENGSGDTSTLQGFSLAIGLTGDVSKSSNPMRFGVLLGRDWAGSNSAVPYEHEGETWIAAQIGFNFAE